MAEMDDFKHYMTDFWQHLSDTDRSHFSRALPSKHSHARTSVPRAYLNQVSIRKPLSLEDISPTIPTESVLIVENIDLAWVQWIGVNWRIDPAFFAAHFASSDIDADIWRHIMGNYVIDQKRPVTAKAQSWSSDGLACSRWHAGGVVEHPRSSTDPWLEQNFIPRKHLRDDAYGWNTETRISCYSIPGQCYLILVDLVPMQAPRSLKDATSTTELHLPVTNNRGGLALPVLFDQGVFSVFELFLRFLTHSWLFHDILFPEKHSPPTPELLFHLLASSTWKANLRMLSRQINRIAFEDLRRPDDLVNDRLHDSREKLMFLRRHVSAARKWMPGDVMQQVKQAVQPQAGHDDFPNDMLQEILVEADDLQKLLMDSFHLLMSSTSVLEAKASIEQARRAQRITHLAFLYIPVTFVTGIFGMNVTEINGSPLSLWVVAVVLVITVVLTACVFLGYVWLEDWQDNRKRQRQH